MREEKWTFLNAFTMWKNPLFFTQLPRCQQLERKKSYLLLSLKYILTVQFFMSKVCLVLFVFSCISSSGILSIKNCHPQSQIAQKAAHKVALKCHFGPLNATFFKAEAWRCFCCAPSEKSH